MKLRTRTTHKQEEQGQALVEFALVFTMLAMLVMGVLAFGLILTNEISLLAAARAAGRTATLHDTFNYYCSEPGDQNYNTPTYNRAMSSLGGLPPENIESIIIFNAEPGMESHQDVLDQDGSLLIDGFPNAERCTAGMHIGVELRYNQEVPVPIVNKITGDVMILRARVVFRVD